MQTTKISVALICGGQSPEHDVSLMSAQNVFNAIDSDRYTCAVYYISKTGSWHYVQPSHHSTLRDLPSCELPLVKLSPCSSEKKYFTTDHHDNPAIDIAFPVLHGQMGEDGTLQGLCKMLNLPFVGNDVLSSSLCMDKDVTKRLLQQAGIKIPRFLVFHAHEKNQIIFENIVTALGLPFFMKPANTGSSIGVKKIKDSIDFDKALSAIFYYDNKILVEEFISGREIEIAVLGNEFPTVSQPGEIICHHEFYSYEAKYLDDSAAEVIVPALLTEQTIQQFQQIAIQAFKTLCCQGLARVDFFLSEDNEIYLNEINTLPGFTNISMYPKCFQVSGVSYSSLINQLLQLGLEKQRHFGV